jgi:hypothetical protein
MPASLLLLAALLPASLPLPLPASLLLLLLLLLLPASLPLPLPLPLSSTDDPLLLPVSDDLLPLPTSDSLSLPSENSLPLPILDPLAEYDPLLMSDPPLPFTNPALIPLSTSLVSLPEYSVASNLAGVAKADALSARAVADSFQVPELTPDEERAVLTFGAAVTFCSAARHTTHRVLSSSLASMVRKSLTRGVFGGYAGGCLW